MKNILTIFFPGVIVLLLIVVINNIFNITELPGIWPGLILVGIILLVLPVWKWLIQQFIATGLFDKFKNFKQVTIPDDMDEILQIIVVSVVAVALMVSLTYLPRWLYELKDFLTILIVLFFCINWIMSGRLDIRFWNRKG